MARPQSADFSHEESTSDQFTACIMNVISHSLKWTLLANPEGILQYARSKLQRSQGTAPQIGGSSLSPAVRSLRWRSGETLLSLPELR